MIIEGRHAEVGKGIFISDIQPESVAEQVSARLLFAALFSQLSRATFSLQAGLCVGDMILCVNKDELLGADYDTVINEIGESLTCH